MRRVKPTCFVIMPFRQKWVGDEEIDFDKIWSELIKPAAERAGFDVDRADTGEFVGLISPAMHERIYQADLAIVDTTADNLNVYYELGVRHALHRHGTILVERKGGDGCVINRRKPGWWRKTAQTGQAPRVYPFDTFDFARFKYTYDMASLEDQIEGLKNAIESRRNSEETDSPIYLNMPELRISTVSGPASGRQDRTYEILDEAGTRTGKFIGFRSGDIANFTAQSGRAVDYWVNSENTLMQMARVYERAISATIRYLGGTHDDINANEYVDTIQNALNVALAEHSNRKIASPGDVLTTTSGRLKQTHGVRAVFHAATVTGSPRKGFAPVDPVLTVQCIARVFEKARQHIRQSQTGEAGRSIIMPLFGTGQGRLDPSAVASIYVAAAMEALLDTPADLAGRDLTHACFSAYSEADIKLMRKVFEALVYREMVVDAPNA